MLRIFQKYKSVMCCIYKTALWAEELSVAAVVPAMLDVYLLPDFAGHTDRTELCNNAASDNLMPTGRDDNHSNDRHIYCTNLLYITVG